MDEEIELDEHQKIIAKAAAANTLMSKLRDVARCINETKKMCLACAIRVSTHLRLTKR